MERSGHGMTEKPSAGAFVNITDDDRSEAERLSLLPQKMQREAVALIGKPGNDPKVPADHRKEARRRERALRTLLRLDRPKKR